MLHLKMTELFGGNYFSPAWPYPSTQTVFGGAQSLMGHKQSPIRSVIKVNWSLDFLKVLRFSFPVPVVWPSSLARFCRRNIYIYTDKNHRSIFCVKSLKEFSSLETYQCVKGFQKFNTGVKLRCAACLSLQFLRFEYQHYDI